MPTEPKQKPALEVSREFMKGYVAKQNARISEQRRETEKKRAVGRPMVPDSQRRGKNILKVYVSDTELEAIKGFIGERSASDVIRQLLLDAADYLKTNG